MSKNVFKTVVPVNKNKVMFSKLAKIMLPVIFMLLTSLTKSSVVFIPNSESGKKYLTMSM